MLGDYNHFSRMVSELGAIGTKSQLAFSAGLILCSVLSVLFILGLSRVCKEIGLSVIPAWILLSFPVSIAGAAIFPLPLRLHLIMGMPSILVIFSPMLGLILWRGKSKPASIKPLVDTRFFYHVAGLFGLHARCVEQLPRRETTIFPYRLVDMVFLSE
jgi:hypothetical protein